MNMEKTLNFEKDLLAIIKEYKKDKWFDYWIKRYEKGHMPLTELALALTCYVDQLEIFERNDIKVIDVRPVQKMIVVSKADLKEASRLNRYFEFTIASRA